MSQFWSIGVAFVKVGAQILGGWVFFLSLRFYNFVGFFVRVMFCVFFCFFIGVLFLSGILRVRGGWLFRLSQGVLSYNFISLGGVWFGKGFVDFNFVKRGESGCWEFLEGCFFFIGIERDARRTCFLRFVRLCLLCEDLCFQGWGIWELFQGISLVIK